MFFNCLYLLALLTTLTLISNVKGTDEISNNNHFDENYDGDSDEKDNVPEKEPDAESLYAVKINGPSEVNVILGGKIKLNCSLPQSFRITNTVWMKDDKLVREVHGNKGDILQLTDSGVTSSLLITDVDMSNTGNYTCNYKGKRDTVFVRVLDLGKKPYNSGSKLGDWSLTLTLSAFALFYVLY